MRSVSLRMPCAAIALALLAAAPAFGAAPVEWTSTFGGPEEEMARSVAPLTDGGYLVGGLYLEQAVSRVRSSHSEIYLARTDGEGAPLWSATFCGNGIWDCAGGIAVDAGDGNYLLLGTEFLNWNHLSRRIVVYKVDGGGNEIWVRRYGWPDATATSWGSYGLDMRPTPDGAFIILGTTNIATPQGILLVKIDGDGNELWKTVVGDPDCTGSALLAADDGGFVVTGYCDLSRGYGMQYDAYLLRADPWGNEEWSTTWGGRDDEYGQAVCPSGDGGYAMAGYVYPSNGSPSDAAVVRFDASGEVVWESLFGGADDDWALGITPAGDGGFVVTGSRRMEGYPDVIGQRLFISKVGASGGRRWEMLFGEPLPWLEQPYAGGAALAPMGDGGFIAAGGHRAFHEGALSQGGYDVYLVKIGPESPAVRIAIDIKPGSDVNPINLSSGGTVPAAVLTGGGFDASTIDPASLTLAGAGVAMRAGRPMARLEDIDGDGDRDLVAHFPTGGLDLRPGDTSAVLTAETVDGLSVEGIDEVLVKAAR